MDENLEVEDAELHTSQRPSESSEADAETNLAEGAGLGTTTTPQSQQFYAAPPSAGYAPPHFHAGLQSGHPHPAHLGHSPPPPPHCASPAYYKDERAQRQHSKLKRKLQEKQTTTTNGAGLRRGSGAKERGMNSVGTSEDGEESSVPDEEDSFHVYITDVLSSVQAPKVSDLSSRSALLQWAPPVRLSESASTDSRVDVDVSESELRYEVLLSDKGKEMKFKSIYSGPSLSCRIQDLRPGQEYSVCLQVHLDELQGSVTDLVKFVTPACEPDQPQPPKLINRTKSSLQLRWNAVHDNGAHVLHYVLEYDEGKGGDFVEFYKGRNKTHTLQKLLPATDYTFRLAAVNEAGRSAYSKPVAFGTLDHPPAQPAPPALVEASVRALRLEWAGGPRDDEFVLQMNDARTKYGFLNVYLGAETGHVARDLRQCSEYSFRLKSKNDGGVSPWSEEVTYYTLPDRPSRPSKPVVKGRIHAHSFKLKWEPPNDTGGSEITKYILEVNSGSGYETVYEGPDTEAVCDRLTPGTTYQLRVGCAAAGGGSDFSDPCTVTTDAVAPGRCPRPRAAGKPTAHSVTIRWTEPDYNGGAPILDYEVEMTPPNGPSTPIQKSKDTECTVTTLEPGRDYAFSVRAVNRIGPGAWSEPLPVTSGAAPPCAPALPRLLCRSATHVYVEWAEPKSNGAAVSEYRVEMSRHAEEEEEFSGVYQGAQASCDVKGLAPFHSYYFRVQAGNSAGLSPYSPVAGTVTPAAPPSAVASVKTEATPTSIALSWATPSENGSPITHYNIELSDRTISTQAPTTEYVIEGLQPDTVYKVKIQAVNMVAAGPFSGSMRVSTLRLPPVAPRLECLATAHNYIKLKWGEGKNTEYTQYCVEMENPRSREYQCVYKGTALTCKVNKLHEQTSYKFRINASSDAGTGSFSAFYEFATATAPPAAVKAPKLVEVEQRSCSVEWLPAKNPFADAVVYQVQLAKAKEQVFRQVYKTSECKCTIDDLDPGTDYVTRVCPARLTPTTPTGELPGPCSPALSFATPPAESALVGKATPTVQSSPHPHHAVRHRSLYHSVWQATRWPEEYCIYVYAVSVLVLGIVLSLGIASFL
ncbi:unnamed protein product [Phaedon cochleariae]|uniref:Fibronectin type-III domain-containing protein n=1 Tax=Phaedon cochleariae TaxID=80249 RepID=A0A9P0GQ58_PHACE|nr:unnamed protein product [Phaedon cochleariae]